VLLEGDRNTVEVRSADDAVRDLGTGNRVTRAAGVPGESGAPARQGPQAATTQEWTDLSPHEIRYVTVAPDVRLEVLDWGGDGIPLVFLAGANFNAHSFDHFAPKFTDVHRVLGITRRGHGASSWPDSGYDLPTLVEDIRVVLDSLGIDRAILAGHSMAGSEMTLFATESPDRVAGVIYIDAGHDPTDIARLGVPEHCSLTPALLEAMERTFENPELVRRTQWQTDENGARRPFASAAVASIDLPTPDYSGVRAPALGIYYAPERTEDVFMGVVEQSAACVAAFERYIHGGMAAFTDGVEQATVIEMPDTNHNIHLASPDALEEVMRQWLDSYATIADSFVVASGVRLHYLDFGGEGMPIVFVHSEAWDAHTYAEFAPRFADRNRVLAVTRPGYGASEPHPDGVGVEVQARSLVDFLDALGLERAVFAGNASATAELTFLGEHHADRVAGLIYFTGLAVPWLEEHDSDPTRAFEMFRRASPGAGAAAERERARKTYRPEHLHADRPTIPVPALAFVARSGTMANERGIGALALVGSPLMDDVRNQMPQSPVRDHLERLASDESYRTRQLEQIEDPEAREYFLRLAADPELQETMYRYHEDVVLPALRAAQERFRRAFADDLRLIRLDVDQVAGYEYRDSPELLEAHVRRFLTDLEPVGEGPQDTILHTVIVAGQPAGERLSWAESPGREIHASHGSARQLCTLLGSTRLSAAQPLSQERLHMSTVPKRNCLCSMAPLARIAALTGVTAAAVLPVLSAGAAAQEARSPWEIAGVPALNFDSDEGFGYGVVVELYRNDPERRLLPYRFTIQPTVQFSTKGRRDLTLFFDAPHLLPPGWRLTAQGGDEHHIATPYYGVGNQTSFDAARAAEDGPDPSYYRFGRTRTQLAVDVQRRLGDTPLRLLVGGGVGRVTVDPEARERGTTLLAQELAEGQTELPGEGFRQLRAGIVWDGRDREVGPRRGAWTDLLVQRVGGTSAGRSGYTRWTVTDRRYFSVRPGVVLANRILVQGISGEAAFYELQVVQTSFKPQEGLGGAKTLRGIPKNRYTGEGIFLWNAEVRWRAADFQMLSRPVHVVLSGFVDSGRVWDRSPELRESFTDLHHGFGGGARLGMGESFVVALDVGHSSQATAPIYIGLGYLY
jgi:pimeloyl-ACP methyl ester carboxylesterase